MSYFNILRNISYAIKSNQNTYYNGGSKPPFTTNKREIYTFSSKESAQEEISKYLQKYQEEYGPLQITPLPANYYGDITSIEEIPENKLNEYIIQQLQLSKKYLIQQLLDNNISAYMYEQDYNRIENELLKYNVQPDPKPTKEQKLKRLEELKNDMTEEQYLKYKQKILNSED